MISCLEELRSKFGRTCGGSVVVRIPTIFLLDTTPEYQPGASEKMNAYSLAIEPSVRLNLSAFNWMGEESVGAFNTSEIHDVLKRADLGDSDAFQTLAINIRGFTRELNRIACKHQSTALKLSAK